MSQTPEDQMRSELTRLSHSTTRAMREMMRVFNDMQRMRWQRQRAMQRVDVSTDSTDAQLVSRLAVGWTAAHLNREEQPQVARQWDNVMESYGYNPAELAARANEFSGVAQEQSERAENAEQRAESAEARLQAQPEQQQVVERQPQQPDIVDHAFDAAAITATGLSLTDSEVAREVDHAVDQFLSPGENAPSAGASADWITEMVNHAPLDEGLAAHTPTAGAAEPTPAVEQGAGVDLDLEG